MNVLTTVRRLGVTSSLCVLAACGGTAYIGGGPAAPSMTTPNSGAAKGPAPTAPPVPTPSPSPKAAPAPTAIPVAPATPVATAPVASPRVSAFAIEPRFPGGAGGTVVAAATSRGVHYHVVVTGLVPGSAHTIHDHLGTCSASPGSRHLAVLDTSTADSRGTIVIDTTVPAFDFGANRIVIVYNTASPQLITGCAAL